MTDPTETVRCDTASGKGNSGCNEWTFDTESGKSVWKINKDEHEVRDAD